MRLSDQQLSQKMKDRDTDPDTKGIMQGEIMRRKHVRGGMANGGVVAFAGTDGSEVKDDEKSSELGRFVREHIPKKSEKDDAAGRGISEGNVAYDKQIATVRNKMALLGGSTGQQTKAQQTDYERAKKDLEVLTNAKFNLARDVQSLPYSKELPAAAPVAADARPNDGKFVDATKPVAKTTTAAPVPKNAAPRAAPAARSSDTGAPSPTGDSYESLLNASLKNAGKTSPETTAVLDQLGARAKMTPAQHYAETEGFRKQMGVDTGAMLEGQRETQRGMSEDVEERGKYAAHMRNAQMFAKIAMTPGPILSAAAKAMNDVIPEMIEDAEKQEKAQNEIKKALAALDMSEYLDKAGKADKALEARNTANAAILAANMEIDKAKQEAEKSKLTALSHIVTARETGKSHERSAAISASARGTSSGLAAEKFDEQKKSKAMSEHLTETKKLRDELLNTEKYINSMDANSKGRIAQQAKADRLKEQISASRREAFARHGVEPPPSDVGAKKLPAGFKLDK